MSLAESEIHRTSSSQTDVMQTVLKCLVRSGRSKHGTHGVVRPLFLDFAKQRPEFRILIHPCVEDMVTFLFDLFELINTMMTNKVHALG
jgi:hypothetical protein